MCIRDRLKEDGRYELVSGHRRKKACELAGLETLKCEVKELTRDEAIIVMAESNLQRSMILPSEKAFAYKMPVSYTHLAVQYLLELAVNFSDADLCFNALVLIVIGAKPQLNVHF